MLQGTRGIFMQRHWHTKEELIWRGLAGMLALRVIMTNLVTAVRSGEHR